MGKYPYREFPLVLGGKAAYSINEADQSWEIFILGRWYMLSIFNYVIGPVIRGPSSSHTGASYFIGRVARSLLMDEPKEVTFTFDVNGSYARVYRQQGSDLAFACGVLGWEISDERFTRSLEIAPSEGVEISFRIGKLPSTDHPNDVDISMVGKNGKFIKARAKSIGGGAILFTEVNGWPVEIRGDRYDLLILAKKDSLTRLKEVLGHAKVHSKGDLVLLQASYTSSPRAIVESVEELPGVLSVHVAEPVFFPCVGKPLFSSGNEALKLSEANSYTLGELGIMYESQLLGIERDRAMKIMLERYRIMRDSVSKGLENDKSISMRLLNPVAGKIYQADREGRLPQGGLHTRAAARAMAVMHICNSMGIVCAAPTAGSAGVIPAVATTLEEEWGLSEREVVKALFAASVVGLIIGIRATFAAEEAGCQVEISAAGAMAAAAVVEAFGGNARQALDAAAISLQNTMGLICDPVQGFVEIPCHTRNAIAASSAFVCADLIVGGYENPIPLDETVDAVYSVGKMLPRELRCTALGGLAVCPSALALKPRTIR